ncbi:MAG: hypothetical protein L0H12_01900 [Nitrosospira sp.]|nr:hypothetical protein [Nitrosospira sp.]
MKKMTLLAALLTSILTLGATPFATAQDNTQGKKGDKEKAPVILLVPPVFALNAALADGCWSRLFYGANFRGNFVTLTGPIAIPLMPGVNFAWNVRYDSLKVGPKATLRVYDNDMYQDMSAVFKPGQEVADLDDKLKLFENIRSLVLDCAK